MTDTSWSKNNFIYGTTFTAAELADVPPLDIARGKIILAEFDSSGNITNYPTPFFILSTSKIYNTGGFPNMPASPEVLYQQFLLAQGNSKDFGTTSNSVTNGQDPKNFYFSPFNAQAFDELVPVYAYESSDFAVGGPSVSGIAFFRADIFMNNIYQPSSTVVHDYEKSYIKFIDINKEYKPSTLKYVLPSPLGVNKDVLVYLCAYYSGTTNQQGTYATYSKFLTLKDMSDINGTSLPISADFNNVRAGRIFYNFNNNDNSPASTNNLIPGLKQSVNIAYHEFNGLIVSGAATFGTYGTSSGGFGYPLNFLTSVGGTIKGGNDNKTNSNMGFTNSNVYYQNNPANYLGSYYTQGDTVPTIDYIRGTINPDSLSDQWSIGSLITYNSYTNTPYPLYDGKNICICFGQENNSSNSARNFNGYCTNRYGGNAGIDTYDSLACNAILSGITQKMIFQFIPLNCLSNPGLGFVSYPPPNLNLTYPAPPTPPPPPPPPPPPEKYPISIPNYFNTTYINGSTTLNAISRWFTATSDVACSRKLGTGGYCGFTPQYYYNSIQGIFYENNYTGTPVCGEYFDLPDETTGYSSSCDNFHGTGTKAACVPNFDYLNNILGEEPFICGPSNTPFTSPGYAMEFDNFKNYFKAAPDSIPHTVNTFTARPYYNVQESVQHDQGAKSPTFWNSTVYVVLAIILFVGIIIGFVFFVLHQGNKKDKFPRYLNKYYT